MMYILPSFSRSECMEHRRMTGHAMAVQWAGPYYKIIWNSYSLNGLPSKAGQAPTDRKYEIESWKRSVLSQNTKSLS